MHTSARIDRYRGQRTWDTYRQMNLTSSLVDLSCRWPGEEVKRSGKTELGREPGDESDLWKSPPPLERSPSRFCKSAIFHLIWDNRNNDWKGKADEIKRRLEIGTWISVLHCSLREIPFLLYSDHFLHHI